MSMVPWVDSYKNLHFQRKHLEAGFVVGEASCLYNIAARCRSHKKNSKIHRRL
jgi:hypothetical protein